MEDKKGNWTSIFRTVLHWERKGTQKYLLPWGIAFPLKGPVKEWFEGHAIFYSNCENQNSCHVMSSCRLNGYDITLVISTPYSDYVTIETAMRLIRSNIKWNQPVQKSGGSMHRFYYDCVLLFHQTMRNTSNPVTLVLIWWKCKGYKNGILTMYKWHYIIKPFWRKVLRTNNKWYSW